ncbi:hypothetical protein GCM10009839_41840 [Catenulispora yoronensis]|uniref:DUF4082 domain-containing protein n=1 Tax=Catenulispora yoronensis TaxID=450799 RepID=A0ABP5FY13_9ACTN
MLAFIALITAFTVAAAPARAATCPCTVFSASEPTAADAGDGNSVELGVKIRASVVGDITGVRFYKSPANTGTHTGSLWTATGTLLATGTFADETASGWQTLTFAAPVPIKANTTYVASYHAPAGHYAADYGFAGAGSAPITALPTGADGDNGVYVYGSATAFPTNSYNSANYWVDAVFDDTGVPTAPPTVTSTSPASAATGVPSTTVVTAAFSAPMDPATLSFTLAENPGPPVPGTVSYDAAHQTATFTPSTQLALGATFSASVQGSDAWGHAMPSATQWGFTTGTTPPPFTCPCSVFDSGATPAVADAADTASVELGLRFSASVDGTITGIRFYKGTDNTGTHTGSLWSATGTLLASGTFAGESASGWQTLVFAAPVAVTANTVYVASYHAPSGHYSYSLNYLGYPHIAYPLTAEASTPGQGNGTFSYGTTSAFPANASNGSNYWVDVTFTAA